MAGIKYTDVKLVENDGGEILKLGPLTIRILEDGSNTDNRIGSMSLTIKGKSEGPPIHVSSSELSLLSL